MWFTADLYIFLIGWPVKYLKTKQNKKTCYLNISGEGYACVHEYATIGWTSELLG